MAAAARAATGGEGGGKSHGEGGAERAVDLQRLRQAFDRVVVNVAPGEVKLGAHAVRRERRAELREKLAALHLDHLQRRTHRPPCSVRRPQQNNKGSPAHRIVAQVTLREARVVLFQPIDGFGRGEGLAESHRALLQLQVSSAARHQLALLE